MTELYRILGIPFGYLLTLIYEAVNSYGLSLIFITLFTRLLMIPSSLSQQKGTAKMQRLQPKIRRIQTKYAGNQQKINEEMQALYAREGHNPMNAGCLPMVIQMPILFGLIGAIYYPLKYPLALGAADITTLTEAVKALYPKAPDNQLQLYVVEHIGELVHLVTDGKLAQSVYNTISTFDFRFLGMSLGEKPDFGALAAKNYAALALWLVPISSFLASFATSIFTFLKQRQTNPEAAKNPAMGCMTFVMPVFSLVIAFQFPVGIGMYWTAGSLFALVQTIVFSFTHSPKKLVAKLMVEDTIARRSKEQNTKKVSEMKSK